VSNSAQNQAKRDISGKTTRTWFVWRRYSYALLRSTPVDYCLCDLEVWLIRVVISRCLSYCVYWDITCTQTRMCSFVACPLSLYDLEMLFVLQCVAVCCSVLQCVAVCCRVLQCVAVCCSVSVWRVVINTDCQCISGWSGDNGGVCTECRANH